MLVKITLEKRNIFFIKSIKPKRNVVLSTFRFFLSLSKKNEGRTIIQLCSHFEGPHKTVLATSK